MKLPLHSPLTIAKPLMKHSAGPLLALCSAAACACLTLCGARSRSRLSLHPLRVTVLALVLFGLLLGHARAAAPVIDSIVMVPRLTIRGEVGSTNLIEYSTDLNPTNWLVLTNLVLTESPYWFVDVTAPPALRRFYRVPVVVPPTGMALIPAGAFAMGDALDGLSDAPVHTVNVSAFYMDKYAVTKALWDEVYLWAVTHGYSFTFAGSGKAANHPVQTVSWYDCVKWCNARSEKEGRVPAYYADAGQTVLYRSGQVNVSSSGVKWSSGYRLPTEAEWEKAARGGLSGQRFPWGNTISQGQANYYASSGSYSYDLSPEGFHPAYSGGGYPYTSPVGSFAANGYGLYDMAGNVWNWCWDWNGSYASGSQSDPVGPTSGFNRVFRGGSWISNAYFCRTADRYAYSPDGIDFDVGFRSVLPPGQ